MKLTAKQLKKIITEEFESVMKEQGAELYRAFNSATMNMLKAGHSTRDLIDMVKSHARGRMIQNMSDEERIAMWKKMGIKQEELSEGGLHPGVHEEVALTHLLHLTAQVAHRFLSDKDPNLIPEEKVSIFIGQLTQAMQSIMAEIIEPEIPDDYSRGEWEQRDPTTKYRG